MSDYINDFYKSFGNKTNSMRRKKELTQEVVSKTLGINRATLANLEAGDHRIVANHLFELCIILDLNINEIFSDYKKAKLSAELSLAPDVLKEVVTTFNERSKEDL